MLRAVLLLTIATAVSLGVEDFFKKYTFAKTMAHCFGGTAYEDYLLLIAEAKRECNGYSTYSSYTTSRPRYPPCNTDDCRSHTTQRPGFNQFHNTQRPGINQFHTTQRPGFNQFHTTQRPGFNQYHTTQRPGFNNFFATQRPGFDQSITTYKPFFTLVTSPGINVITAPPNRNSGSRPSNPRYGPQHQFITNPFDMNLLFPSGDRSKNLQNREKLYDSEAISEAIEEITYALRNFTCVLGKLQMIDQRLNINYQMMIRNYFRSSIDGQLRDDLINGINYCRELVNCLPEDKSPVSYELQRIMAFVKCEKKTRLSACFKQDLRNNLHHFDTSALPDDNMRTSDLDKLMTILIGPESLDQLELF